MNVVSSLVTVPKLDASVGKFSELKLVSLETGTTDDEGFSVYGLVCSFVQPQSSIVRVVG